MAQKFASQGFSAFESNAALANDIDMSVPSNVKVRIFDENDYAEYEKITGKRIRDLNKQRNFMVETVKKEWK